jgi:pimeloyl-ACP methyl ester carboxylesterase
VNKKTWVFLRGLTRESQHWGNFIEKFKKDNLGEVICLDLPGFGYNYHSTMPNTISKTSDFLRQQFLAMKIVGEVNILGISLGGMVALNWASRFPDFKNVVVINTSSSENSILDRVRPLSLLQLSSALLMQNTRCREWMILNTICNTTFGQSFFHQFAKIEETRPLKIEKIVTQLKMASKFKLPKNLKIKLLVLTAKKDRMVSSKCSEQIAKKYNSTLYIHPTAGHELPLDDGPWVVEQIQNWMSSNK